MVRERKQKDLAKGPAGGGRGGDFDPSDSKEGGVERTSSHNPTLGSGGLRIKHLSLGDVWAASLLGLEKTKGGGEDVKGCQGTIVMDQLRWQ